MKSLNAKTRTRQKRRGILFLEYILLLTIIGIGAIVGLAAVRHALVHELEDVAHAIHHIHHHHGGGHDHGDGDGDGDGHGNGHGGNGNGHGNGHGNNGNGHGHGDDGDDDGDNDE